MTDTGLDKKIDPPISSGWRGELSGHIVGTDSWIKVSQIELKLDHETAYALANMLTDSVIDASMALEIDQAKKLKTLGAALGILVGNPSANNGGRKVLK